MPINPVFYHSGGRIQDVDSPFPTTLMEPAGWYFWTETWAHYMGPYSSQAVASQMLVEYGKSL